MKVSKIYGFISYAHSDGTDLTEGLDKYLKQHSSNFESIYDGDVPEGEKLEKILEKLSLCDVLIIVITTASLTSKAVAEEIKLAKEKRMKIIPCKNKYVAKEWGDLPWNIQEYKGFDFENIHDLRRKAVFSLGKMLKEIEKPESVEDTTDEEEYEQQLALAEEEEEEYYRRMQEQAREEELDEENRMQIARDQAILEQEQEEESRSQESIEQAELEQELQAEEMVDQQQMEAEEAMEQESIEQAELEQELQSQTEHEPIIQTDKSVYMYNSDMILTVIVKNSIDDFPINIKILSEEKKIVYKNIIPIDKKNNGIYQEVIRISGDDWLRKPGAEYTIIAEHGGNSSQLAFFLASFGATIELDQKVYTWTDKVYITVVAPDLVTNFDKIEIIGNKPDSLITISTRNSKITGYKLMETGKGTGVFTGEIILTGFSGYDVKGNKQTDAVRGITKGRGHTDGLLSCNEDDGVTITLTTPYLTVSGSALIRWNIGEIEWVKPEYEINESATIIVIDPDMNLNPEIIDVFNIRVWSDTDPVGIELPVVETDKATGIFMGVVSLTAKPSSKGNLMVSKGDGVVAEYVDRTLPDPYPREHSLKMTAYATIL